MKQLLFFVLFFVAGLPITKAQEAEPMAQVVERGLSRARSQSLLIAGTLKDEKDALPRTFEKGKLQTIRYDHWVSGFFPGLLWMLYEDSGNQQLREFAEMYTARVEPAKKLTNTHDLGFMLYCSFGQGYRLTGNQHYLDVISEGTKSLLTRWNEKLGVIKSWDWASRWQYPVIIDNMMNLEMLCFMTKQTGNPEYQRIAEKHAQTTMKNHFRPDFSTYHVVSYDTITGQPHAKNTAQGYSDSSSWSRGQAWGLYGYTMMYRETKNPIYLKQAQEIGRFLMNHPRLPEDKVPYWDYDAPDIPGAKRDASAAAIMASAFIELSQLDRSQMSSQWLNLAEQQLRTLSSPAYLAEEGEQGGFIIKHGVGHYSAGTEVDVPLTYGDYYYVEALLRLKQLFGKPLPQAAQTKWLNPLEQGENIVHGRWWNSELKDGFHRLTPRAEGKVRSAVWRLARQSAGLSVCFHTNAPSVKVRYKVKGGLNMFHMPTTGVSGVDLYATDANGQQRWCASKFNVSFKDTVNYEFKDLTYFTGEDRGYDFELFLPLYNEVAWMEIGVPGDRELRFIPAPAEQPIVVYGTSIAHGACASRPGMAWTNIVHRESGYPVVNLGFSGNGQLEEEMFDFLAEIDAKLFVIDCLPNMATERTELIYDRLLKGISILREKSQAPILLVEHNYANGVSSQQNVDWYTRSNQEQQRAYKALRKQGVKNLFYLSHDELGFTQDSMVEGLHPNDLGMRQYADAYLRKIRKILPKRSPKH